MQPTTKNAAGGSLVLATLFGLAFGWAEQSSATTLGISPVKIVLSASSRSVLVTLTNNSDSESRIEVSASTWGEDAAGRAVMEPSEDLAVFPPIVVIPAKGEKRIRVGLARHEPVATERAYRLFLQEMPASDVAQEQAGIRMLMRFSLPVFVQPAKPAGRVAVAGLEVEGGHARFQLTNGGNAHARIQDAKLLGKDALGKTVFTRELDIRVILAGGQRALDLALPAGECRPSATVELQMLADGKAVSANAKPGSCGE